MRDTLDRLVSLIEDPNDDLKWITASSKRVSPVEFVMIGVLVRKFKDTQTDEQLKQTIQGEFCLPPFLEGD